MGLFSVFGASEKKNNGGDAYYRRISKVFTLLKLLCILLLILSVLLGFSFRTDEISMDNFRYLFNTLGSDNTQNLAYKNIYYDSSDQNSFALIRGDLAVVNSGGSAVYSLSGQRKSADSSLKMDNPTVLSGAKYMYIYDLGGTELVIKDTLDTVDTKKYSYPIRAAAVTDGGYFTVVSSEKSTRSTVFVYDDKYREVYKRSYGTLYTTSADLNDDASRLLCASFTAEDGKFVTEALLYSLTAEDPLFTYTCEGEYPYKVQFTKSGGFMLLTDKGCRFFNSNLDCVAFCEFGSDGIDGFYMDDSHFAELISASAMTAEKQIRVYGENGEVLLEKFFSDGIGLASCDGDFLFTVSGGALFVTDLASGEERNTSIANDVLDLLPIGDRSILVLTEGEGYVLNYGELFNKETEVSE